MKVAFQVAARFGGTGLGYISYQAVRGIRDAGMLAGVTCISRAPTDIDDALITQVRAVEKLSRVVPRGLANKLGLDALLQQNYFGYAAARRLHDCDIVHGYTGQMLETIHAVRTGRGGRPRCIVDRPNTHVHFMRRALLDEYAKYGVPFAPYSERQVRREAEELEMADAIVTCSQFARKTMTDEGLDDRKIHVVPYGVDLDLFRPAPRQTRSDTGPFRVAFAGLICLRKGVQYLLEAWERLELPGAELVLQGHLLDDAAGVVRYYANRIDFTILAHSENMADVCRLYNSADVCVFPSVEDGFGMVVAEAMACNRPVIVTTRMGAAGLVRDGVDGFVIPPGDVQAIKERLSFLHAHRNEPIGTDGRSRLADLTWDNYRAGLLGVYESLEQTNAEAHCVGSGAVS